MKKFLSATLVLLLLATSLFAFCACKSDDADAAEIIAGWQSKYTAGEFGIRSKKDPFVELTLSTGAKIRLELYPSVAPASVENFIRYVQDGFYEGVAFHRIIQGFMIQTGGFEEKNGVLVQKDPTYPAITGEFSANGIRNDLSHTRGVISMARSGVNTATSQFFICSEILEEQTESLNGNYAAFGRVIDKESMAVVTRLEKTETHDEDLYYGTQAVPSNDVPVEKITIRKATLVWTER